MNFCRFGQLKERVKNVRRTHGAHLMPTLTRRQILAGAAATAACAAMPTDVAPKFYPVVSSLLAVCRGALGIAQRQIPARMAGEGDGRSGTGSRRCGDNHMPCT